MVRTILLNLILGYLLMAAAPALAAPGDPFGGDDTGCVPSTKLGLSCAKKVGTVVFKLKRAVLKCHLTQAELAFKTGHSSPGFDNSEEHCEVGNPSNSAKAKFDEKIAQYAASGCSATVIANANTTRDEILADQNTAGSLDELNGLFFCDSASGALIADTTGADQDEGGWIPNTPENFKCSVAVAKAWSKLDGYVLKCHQKMAAYGFKGTSVFDEESCESLALSKYSAAVNKYVSGGICPPCLASNGPALGPATVATADANLEDVYVCPAP
jgi:hypothetical protein